MTLYSDTTNQKGSLDPGFVESEDESMMREIYKLANDANPEVRAYLLSNKQLPPALACEIIQRNIAVGGVIFNTFAHFDFSETEVDSIIAAVLQSPATQRQYKFVVDMVLNFRYPLSEVRLKELYEAYKNDDDEATVVKIVKYVNSREFLAFLAEDGTLEVKKAVAANFTTPSEVIASMWNNPTNARILRSMLMFHPNIPTDLAVEGLFVTRDLGETSSYQMVKTVLRRRAEWKETLENVLSRYLPVPEGLPLEWLETLMEQNTGWDEDTK